MIISRWFQRLQGILGFFLQSDKAKISPDESARFSCKMGGPTKIIQSLQSVKDVGLARNLGQVAARSRCWYLFPLIGTIT